MTGRAKKHFNIKIYGVVQGVCFRFYARKKAEELGLAGFVRNEPEGAVYAEVEGGAEALQKFSAWCRFGPRSARVDKVEIAETGRIRGWKDFRIRR